jgi:hypothetical protein
MLHTPPAKVHGSGSIAPKVLIEAKINVAFVKNKGA